MFQFIKTTALGGILFLIPVIILVAVFTQAHQLVSKIAAPVLAIMPVERVFGIVVLNLLILTLGVLICFLAGLAAKSPVAVRLVASLESKFLSKVPAYDVEKTKLASRMRFEEGTETQPVLVRFDDQWQIGFEVDNIAGGKVAVFLPGAPDPWSGSVSIVTDDRITRLDSTLAATLGIFKHLGKGASDQLQTCMKKS
jgi:uncharacterized membrane protein